MYGRRTQFDTLHGYLEWKHKGEGMSKMKERLGKLDYYDGFYEGMKEGIRFYAWWEDGVQYVGTAGTTLAEALDEVDKLAHSVKHSGCEPSELR